MPDMNDIIATLELQPHPEGGWYRESYRSTESILPSGLPARFEAQRSHATSIYFLLGSDNFSALHRIKSDEQWHFYTGSSLTIHVIHPDGRYAPIKLGSDLSQNENFQTVVPHGCWFGATVNQPNSFTLVGCSVAPGFDFADFELAERRFLCAEFPQHAELITWLTRI
jgi:predicted cupin superfamily sugar epimerase